MEDISFDLVGKVLEQDIVSELGVLLLKKGSIITETHVLLLQKHNYKKVKVSENRSFKGIYLKYVQNIEQLFSNIETLKDESIHKWFEDNQNIARAVQKENAFFEQMYLIEGKQSLYRHSGNVGLLAFYLGKLLRYSYKNKQLLWKMGVLHDIGKLKLNMEMNNKDVNDLTAEELEQYKQHPELGAALLKELKGVNAMMINGARFHHERIDGSGFPKGVNVKYIPVMVQIISVANKIDHILREKGNIFTLVNILIDETRENKLSPAVVNPLVRHLLRKYVGRKVLLSDESKGEIAFIFDNEPSQPLIYLKETDHFIDLRKHHQLKIVNFG